MLAVYATHAAPDDPLSALEVGEQPEPNVPEGWVRVKVSHASLNRHDVFTLRGISGHPEGITYPIILGNDAAGTLDDGTPVVIFEQGEWHRDRMNALRILEADVMAAVRQRGLMRLDQVRYAVVERDGKVSIIPQER